MRNQISTTIEGIVHLVLLLAVGLTPLLFLNRTTEFFDMPKLVFLLIAVVALLGLTIFSWIIKGKITISRTPLDLPLVLLLAVVFISTFFSGTRLQAIYGDFPSIHGSAISWAVYILLFFVTVANLQTTDKIRNFLYVLYASTILVTLITLASFFGVFLPVDFAKAVNFTPTGSSFSTISLLMLLLPLPLLSTLHPNRYLNSNLAVAITAVFGIVIALIGSVPVYVVMLLVFALCLFISRNTITQKGLMMYITSAAIIGVVLFLAYMPFPGNKVQKLEAAYPKEVQLSLPVSWKVSISAFRDAPFFGTGPSSNLFNFTTYKPVEFNLLKYWNFTFRDATNELLQVLATLGLFGFIALIMAYVVIIRNSAQFMSITRHDDNEKNSHHLIMSALAVSALVVIALSIIHTNTLVSTVVTFFMLAVFMMSQDSIRNKETSFSLGIKAGTSQGSQFDLLPVVIFLAFIVGAVTLFTKTYTVVSADYYHRQALLQANKNGTLTYKYLQKAETLNPMIDLYRIDMAQTNFALANAIAVQKGPTKANPKGSLSDADRKTIQTLLSQAINEGRASVVLNPRSSRNWEVLASIYRNITGVARNALTFSLDAYGKAVQRDPLNPNLRFTVGGLYYSLKNYDLAVRFFTDAINLKPDYANAYYNLALAYREKGDIQSAKLVADQTLKLVKKDTNPKEYETITKLSKDLQTQLDALAAQQKAQASTGLKNPNLPSVNVAGLNNTPSVATPSAVKANPNVSIPQVTPTPQSPSPTATP